MSDYELKLTAHEVKLIFDALVERPFKDVWELINKLQDAYKKEDE